MFLSLYLKTPCFSKGARNYGAEVRGTWGRERQSHLAKKARSTGLRPVVAGRPGPAMVVPGPRDLIFGTRKGSSGVSGPSEGPSPAASGVWPVSPARDPRQGALLLQLSGRSVRDPAASVPSPATDLRTGTQGGQREAEQEQPEPPQEGLRGYPAALLGRLGAFPGLPAKGAGLRVGLPGSRLAQQARANLLLSTLAEALWLLKPPLLLFAATRRRSPPPGQTQSLPEPGCAPKPGSISSPTKTLPDLPLTRLQQFSRYPGT